MRQLRLELPHLFELLLSRGWAQDDLLLVVGAHHGVVGGLKSLHLRLVSDEHLVERVSRLGVPRRLFHDDLEVDQADLCGGLVLGGDPDDQYESGRKRGPAGKV